MCAAMASLSQELFLADRPSDRLFLGLMQVNPKLKTYRCAFAVHATNCLLELGGLVAIVAMARYRSGMAAPRRLYPVCRFNQNYGF
jgi:hypothetical protein